MDPVSKLFTHIIWGSVGAFGDVENSDFVYNSLNKMKYFEVAEDAFTQRGLRGHQRERRGALWSTQKGFKNQYWGPLPRETYSVRGRLRLKITQEHASTCLRQHDSTLADIILLQLLLSKNGSAAACVDPW